MKCRNHGVRASRAMAALVLLAVAGGAGCHLLPVGRVNTALDPRTLGKREGSSAVAPGTVAGASKTLDAQKTTMSVPLPELPLEVMTDGEVLAGLPAAGASAETPLLDEALQRARARDDATLFVGRDGSELIEAAQREVREASGPVRGSGFDPVEDQAASMTTSGPASELVLMPPPPPGGPSGVIEPLVGVATGSEAGNQGLRNDVQVVGDVGATEAVVEPPGVVAVAERWAAGLARLRELASEQAATDGAVEKSLWEMRAGLLTWLAEGKAAGSGAGARAGESEHPLWPVVFALLSEAAEGEARAGEDLARTDVDLRAAAWEIEKRLPMRISALELCQRVRSFGNYDVADTSRVEAGQTVTLYCEMEGIQFEPMAEGGFRSRLSSSIEVKRAGTEQAAWVLELGSVEDQCRKRRRDYYVNYRVALPGSGTLPPGDYGLVLKQRDEVSGTVAERAVGITVVEAKSR